MEVPNIDAKQLIFAWKYCAYDVEEKVNLSGSVQLSVLVMATLTSLIVFYCAHRYDRRLKDLSRPSQHEADVNKASASICAHEAHPRRQSRTIRWLRALMIAIKIASALAALGSPILGYIQHFGLITQRLETTATQQTQETLPDSSVVQLGPDSLIALKFGQTDRIINLLRGVIIIDVAKDPERPLTITTRQGVSVIAVGTKLSVRYNLGATDVDVIEGTVKVVTHTGASSARQREFVLHGGQDASVTATGNILQGSSTVPINPDDWPSEPLEFNASRLRDVISAFNAHRKFRLRIDDPELADLRIQGLFNAYNPVGLLEYLERYKGVKAEDSGDGSIVLRRTTPANGTH